MKIKLNDIEKKNPYSVPPNYFEGLTPSIQDRIAKNKPASISYRWSWKWALAPALLVVLGIGFLLNNYSTHNDTTSNMLAGVSNEDIFNYLEQSELTETELLSLSNAPSELLEKSPNYLKGIDLDNQSLDELMETFDLNDDYL